MMTRTASDVVIVHSVNHLLQFIKVPTYLYQYQYGAQVKIK